MCFLNYSLYDIIFTYISNGRINVNMNQHQTSPQKNNTPIFIGAFIAIIIMIVIVLLLLFKDSLKDSSQDIADEDVIETTFLADENVVTTSPEEEISHEYGNTAGNLNIFGNAVEKDGWKYFSDDTKRIIYRTNDTPETAITIKDDGNDAWALNIIGNTLYYISDAATTPNGRAIWCSRTDGSSTYKILELNDPDLFGQNISSTNLWVVDQDLYIITSDGLAKTATVIRTDINGARPEKILTLNLHSKKRTNPYVNIVGNTLYYVNGGSANPGIFKMDLTSLVSTKILDGDFSYLVVQNDIMYFLRDNGKSGVWSASVTGENLVQITTTSCVQMTFSNNTCIIRTGKSADSPYKLHQVNLESGESTLLHAYARNPIVLTDGLYYLVEDGITAAHYQYDRW